MSVTLELDEYERANLKWLLEVGRELGLNTGDWHHQILGRLGAEPGRPNGSSVEAGASLANWERNEWRRLAKLLRANVPADLVTVATGIADRELENIRLSRAFGAICDRFYRILDDREDVEAQEIFDLITFLSEGGDYRPCVRLGGCESDYKCVCPSENP